MKKTILLILLSLMNIIYVTGQQNFDHQQLIDDFDRFIGILKNTHPAPYFPFGGRMLFHKEADKAKSRIPQEGMTDSDFYFLLSAFVSKLHDGHTYIEYPKASGKTDDSKILPIQFRIVSDGMIVIKSTAEWSGLIGRKLISVNNHGIDKLLQLVMQYSPCENISGAYYALSRYLAAQDSAKRIFQEMHESLKFVFSDMKNKTEEKSISYISPKTPLTWVTSKRSEEIKPEEQSPFWFDFIDDEKKIGYFAFNATYAREVAELTKKWGGDIGSNLETLYKIFNLGKVPEDTEEAINKIPSLNQFFFKLLSDMKKNKSTHLIIDLRQNSGGWTPITIPTLYMLCGDIYFTYNCNAEYNTRISELYLKKQNMTIEQYNQSRNISLKIGDYQFGNFMGSEWSPEMSPKERRKKYFENNIDFTSGAELMKSQNGVPVYSPKLIVLTSPKTFSAAFHYLFFLKEIADATIVGVAPRQAFNSGMEVTDFTLPNTRLSGSVSNSYQLFMPHDLEKGRILIPDYEISCNIYADFGYDQDAEIRYAVDMIKNKKF